MCVCVYIYIYIYIYITKFSYYSAHVCIYAHIHILHAFTLSPDAPSHVERNVEGSPTKMAGKAQLHLRMTFIPSAGVPSDAVPSPTPMRASSPKMSSPEPQVEYMYTYYVHVYVLCVHVDYLRMLFWHYVYKHCGLLQWAIKVFLRPLSPRFIICVHVFSNKHTCVTLIVVGCAPGRTLSFFLCPCAWLSCLCLHFSVLFCLCVCLFVFFYRLYICT
jgi:hypothetical protein